jgi:hypothetical protein
LLNYSKNRWVWIRKEGCKTVIDNADNVPSLVNSIGSDDWSGINQFFELKIWTITFLDFWWYIKGVEQKSKNRQFIIKSSFLR